jgi:hypothetical protein
MGLLPGIKLGTGIDVHEGFAVTGDVLQTFFFDFRNGNAVKKGCNLPDIMFQRLLDRRETFHGIKGMKRFPKTVQQGNQDTGIIPPERPDPANNAFHQGGHVAPHQKDPPA